MQETYVRWHQVAPGSVENPEAWLVTTTSRLAIDRLRRLKTEREAYVGPWLPEPIVTEAPPGPKPRSGCRSVHCLPYPARASRARGTCRLSAARCVRRRVSRDCRGDRAERSGVPTGGAPCARARARQAQTLRRDGSHEGDSCCSQFMDAMEARDEQALLSLFAPDATWIADGGGKDAPHRYPIVGADRIARAGDRVAGKVLGTEPHRRGGNGQQRRVRGC